MARNILFYTIKIIRNTVKIFNNSFLSYRDGVLSLWHLPYLSLYLYFSQQEISSYNSHRNIISYMLMILQSRFSPFFLVMTVLYMRKQGHYQCIQNFFQLELWDCVVCFALNYGIWCHFLWNMVGNRVMSGVFLLQI